MDSIQTLTSFFGWMTVLNIGLYLFIVLALFVMRDFVYRLNAKIFALAEDEVAKATFRYVANYKLLLTIFSFIPWLALKLMA